MITVRYDTVGGRLRIERKGDDLRVQFVCSLWDVQIYRETLTSLTIRRGAEYVGLVEFDEVEYGIPIDDRGAK